MGHYKFMVQRVARIIMYLYFCCLLIFLAGRLIDCCDRLYDLFLIVYVSFFVFVVSIIHYYGKFYISNRWKCCCSALTIWRDFENRQIPILTETLHRSPNVTWIATAVYFLFTGHGFLQLTLEILKNSHLSESDGHASSFTSLNETLPQHDFC